MPPKKSSHKPARKISVTPKKTRPSRKTGNKFEAGTYIVPKGHVSIAVPAFWTLRQTNDDLEVAAPSGSTAVIVTAFQRNGDFRSLDAREYLQHFLETAPRNGRLKTDRGTKQKATARYKDPEGDVWQVVFVTNGNTLLLATCNTSLPTNHKEAKTGMQVIESLRLSNKR